jgi:hypothetical protein
MRPFSVVVVLPRHQSLTDVFHRYLRDVLKRLPSHPNSLIDELLPHRWKDRDA